MPAARMIKAPAEVYAMATDVLCEDECYQPLLDAKVRIDYLMCYAPTDDAGAPTGPAISHDGMPALGLAKKTKLEDRALGGGDCRVLLDAAWWTHPERTDRQRRGLLAHELYHFEIVMDEQTGILLDSCKRPKIDLRKHDLQFGWFRHIAKTYGADSVECQQAETMMEEECQTFWPEILNIIDMKEPV